MSKRRVVLMAALASTTVLLGACGGGGGGSGGRASSEPVPLASKSDAMREMALVLGDGPLASLVDLPTAGSARGAARSQAKAVTVNCTQGNYTFERVSGSHDFTLLDPPVPDVDLTIAKDTENNCRQVFADGPTQYIDIYDGYYENGYLGEQPDFSPFKYQQFGSGTKPYLLAYETRANGRRLYYEGTETLGLVESGIINQATQHAVKASIDYVLEDGDESFSYSAVIGDGNTPLRITLPFDSSWIKLAGSYAYSTSSDACDGGKVKVSTPSEGGLILAQGYPDQGQLRLESGSNTALFSFEGDGIISLRINGGAPISVDPFEIREALNSDPCP